MKNARFLLHLLLITALSPPCIPFRCCLRYGAAVPDGRLR